MWSTLDAVILRLKTGILVVVTSGKDTVTTVVEVIWPFTVKVVVIGGKLIVVGVGRE